MSEKGLTLKTFSFLSFAVAVYSCSGIFSKLASEQEFLSLTNLLCLCGVVTVLGVYAVLWQKALKSASLNQAYPFRSLSVVYGLAIAYFGFNEVVTWQNLLGACIVVLGLIIMTTER